MAMSNAGRPHVAAPAPRATRQVPARNAGTILTAQHAAQAAKAARTAGGQRSYNGDDLARLTFIKPCRDFGFGIEQVRVLLELSISSSRDCAETRDIAQTHLDEVGPSWPSCGRWKHGWRCLSPVATRPVPAVPVATA
ncbi:hypothetical protein AGR5A_pa30248 [Agrobacterium genomosp. 5 str. CFBP 6626]|nr:hypothetical protein AGR5A_pa30248 [Agrobacterium genomosp. 5 str. CFBP 6626]